MSCSIDVDAVAQATIAVLPPDLRLQLADAISLLELAPWQGLPVNPELTPDGPVRHLPFGAAGMILI